VSTLYDDEVEKIAGFAKADPNTVADVIAEAVASGLILLLPPSPDRSDFAGWDAFALAGGGKAAHLCETGSWKAFCGAGRPTTAVSPEPRTRVCCGCAYHAELLRSKPQLIDSYDRGRGPREFVASPLPSTFGNKPKAPPEAPEPPKRSARAASPRSVPARAPEPAPVRAAPTPEPEAPAAPAPPSLFDDPTERAPRRRPQSNARTF
jgi:hypothetical protein